MLYLFNSGFRDNYVVNVLNTLCFPFGSTNSYSYGVTAPGNGGTGNISAEEAARICTLPTNEPVLIIFIDRFRNGQPYVYHPLRRGFLVGADIADSRLYIRVKLRESCVASDATAFSDAVTSGLVPLGAPRLTGTPGNSQDGQYAIISTDDLAEKVAVSSSLDDWRTLVDRLTATTALGSSAEQPVVFARAALYKDADRNTSLVPESLADDQNRFRITRGQKYVLVVSYVSPVQAIDKTTTAEMSVTLGDDLRATSDTKAPLNAVARRVEVLFATKQFMEDNKSRLTLAFTAPIGVKKFFAPKIDIPLEITETRRMWGMLAGLTLVYCVGTVAVGLDFSMPVTVGVLIAKVLGSIAQIAAVIGMLHFFGKKYG